MAQEQPAGFNIWTKNLPKDYIGLYADYAQENDLTLTGIVDDLLPEVVFRRTSEETAAYNGAYKEFMERSGFHDVRFVSEFMPSRKGDLEAIVDMGTKLSLTDFMRLLPEKKRNVQTSLTLSEMVDATWQLCVLESSVSALGINRFLTGKRSTALFRLAKEAIPGLTFDIID